MPPARGPWGRCISGRGRCPEKVHAANPTCQAAFGSALQGLGGQGVSEPRSHPHTRFPALWALIPASSGGGAGSSPGIKASPPELEPPTQGHAGRRSRELRVVLPCLVR